MILADGTLCFDAADDFDSSLSGESSIWDIFSAVISVFGGQSLESQQFEIPVVTNIEIKAEAVPRIQFSPTSCNVRLEFSFQLRFEKLMIVKQRRGSAPRSSTRYEQYREAQVETSTVG
jgi:hypothetical protein